ncbi:Rhodanese-like protein [Dendrothele bispora CBS 962.96]|uniref:Rhodanese-like protein n=1 Tax=Dendrothele bispora (strain CBS 962.96) TaxID=1314807 RepID=A0A4S8MSF9_DENBC|nr:Rhodanese-like protein [Dendrothele bispora CBS 962.96]
MFRPCISRVTGSVLRAQHSGSVFSPKLLSAVRPLNVRFESSQPPRPDPSTTHKAARQVSDALERDWDAKIISYTELKPKTESPDPNSFLIDVREPDEVMQGMIPSAVCVPLTVLGEALRMPSETFKEKFGFEKPKRDQEVTFYCRSGKRSTTASDIAKRNGYTNILNYTGSWLEWTEKEK